jgi:hypothetical protein
VAALSLAAEVQVRVCDKKEETAITHPITSGREGKGGGGDAHLP